MKPLKKSILLSKMNAFRAFCMWAYLVFVFASGFFLLEDKARIRVITGPVFWLVVGIFISHLTLTQILNKWVSERKE